MQYLYYSSEHEMQCWILLVIHPSEQSSEVHAADVIRRSTKFAKLTVSQAKLGY